MKTIFFILLFPIFGILQANDSFAEDLISSHNGFRKNHSAPDLNWNVNMQKFAQKWAETIAKKDKMEHRPNNKYGENIYWTSGGKLDAKSAVKAWYDEIKFYNYKKPGFGMKTGHFTQVVWKESTELGCGSAKSKRGGTYLVCNYNPPGNYEGQFKENVLKKK